jgi:hypothetical protein
VKFDLQNKAISFGSIISSPTVVDGVLYGVGAGDGRRKGGLVQARFLIAHVTGRQYRNR